MLLPRLSKLIRYYVLSGNKIKGPLFHFSNYHFTQSSEHSVSFLFNETNIISITINNYFVSLSSRSGYLSINSNYVSFRSIYQLSIEAISSLDLRFLLTLLSPTFVFSVLRVLLSACSIGWFLANELSANSSC